MSSDNEPTPSTSKSSDNESISQETDSPISDNSNPSTSGNEVSLYEEWINPLQDWELLIPAVIVRTRGISIQLDEGCRVSVIYSLL